MRATQVEPIWRFQLKLEGDSLRAFDPLILLNQMIAKSPVIYEKKSELYTILSELYSNALEHGLLRLESGIKNTISGMVAYYQARIDRLKALEQGSIYIEVQFEGTQLKSGWRLKIIFEDTGNGFEYQQQQPDSKNFFGRGMTLLYALCDSVRFSGQGNRVEIIYTAS